VVVCLLCAAAGLWWWTTLSSPPKVQPVDAPGPRPSSSGGEASGGQPTGTAGDGGRVLVVHVAGAVVTPGVYRLPNGSRIHDAIGAAGGAVPEADLHRLNLAAPLEDGVRVLVPRPGDPAETSPSAPSPNAGGGASSRGKVNLNSATAEELAGLPRVGPVLAQRIVEYRQQHGRFASPEDLDAVPGVGAKMLESLLPLVVAQ
jgi:competence protein ComEA